MTAATRPGEWVDTAKGLADVGPDAFEMRIPTDRYTSREYAQREREAIWMRVWQIVGRVDDLPKVGDWKKYEIFDQSFVIVRGKDDKLRGFVNACRHRGNVLCTDDTGNAKRGFLCQYHLWSYDLEGQLRGVLREDLTGQVDRARTHCTRCPSTRSPGSSSSIQTPRRHHCPSASAGDRRAACALPPRPDDHGDGRPGAH